MSYNYHRKRRGGVKLEGGDSGNKCGAGSGNKSRESTDIPEDDKEEIEADPLETEEAEKSRVDDLWASFKKDVGGSRSSFSSGSLTSPVVNAKSTGVSGSPGGNVSRGGGSTSSVSKGKVHFSIPISSVVLATPEYTIICLVWCFLKVLFGQRNELFCLK